MAHVSRRRKKMLVVVVAATAMLLIGVGAWLVIGWSLDIAAPDVSDLLPPAVQVADEANAYTYFRKAAGALRWPRDDYEVYRMLAGETWNQARADELLSANAETLNLLQQALACSAYQPDKMSEWVEGDPHAIWSDDAGELLALRVMQEERAGRGEQAWQARFDLLHFGSLIAMQPRCMVEYMVGLIALNRGLEDVGRRLREPDTSEAELVRVAEYLNRIGPLEQGQVTAIKREFAYDVDSIDEVSRPIDEVGRVGEQHRLMAGYIFQPNKVKAICAESYRVMLANTPLPYAEIRLPEAMPARRQVVPRFLRALCPNNQGEALLKLFVLSPEQARARLETRYKVQGPLDGLRLVVACRLYEMRHGRLPETLDTLVPALLPEVPRDPFDGKPFRYLPGEALVYSVGLDLEDAGGTVGTVYAAPASKGHSWESDDIIFPIHAATR